MSAILVTIMAVPGITLIQSRLGKVSLSCTDNKHPVWYVPCSPCVTWCNLTSVGRFRRTERLPLLQENNMLIAAHHRSNREPYCS